ncbi:MAG: hypothetical protein ABI418_08230 [Jatrophihabitantaceae bacterium]
MNSRALFRRKALGVVAVAVMPLAAVAFTQPASAAPAHGYYVAITGVRLDPGRTYTIEQLRHLQQQAAPMVMHRVPTSVGPGVDKGVTPYSVASGFVLYNPGYRRDAYTYDSNWGPDTEEYCNGSCTQVSYYQTQLHEVVYGGSSKTWVLKISVQHISGDYAADFSWWYACAVNVSGPDHYCKNGADPSQTSEPMGSSGTTLYEHFENNAYNNTEFPMVAATVDWGSVAGVNRNRGWDACTGPSTVLCTTSGTGA